MTAPAELGDRSRDTAVRNAQNVRCTECRALAEVGDTIRIPRKSWCLRGARLRLRRAAARPGEVKVA